MSRNTQGRKLPDMIEERNNKQPVVEIPAAADGATPPSTPLNSESLSNADQQAEYRREYLAQLRRRACPGCGEDVEYF